MSEDMSASKTGEVVREYLDELFDLDTHDGILPREVYLMVQDIGSLWRVDWHSVGEHYLTTVREIDDES